MLTDVRYAVRSLRRSPGFTAAAVVTLALGIGAAAAMFDLALVFYLRPPPGIADADALVSVQSVLDGRIVGSMTYLDFDDLRSAGGGFSGVMAYLQTEVDLGRGDATRRVRAAVVSSNYFAVLGVTVARGRAFLPEEERPTGAHALAVISHRLWRTDYGAAADVVGRSVVVNGRSLTVVGVAPPSFAGGAPDQGLDVWVPLAMHVVAATDGLTSLDNRVWRWLTVVGRLGPGVGLTPARARASAVARQLERAGAGDGARFDLALEPVRPSLLRDTYALLLFGGVGVLFLVVCANLSNLYLARAGGRRKEIATRLALGAPRGRLVRRMLTESVLLGLAGGALGLLVAPSLARGILVWSAADGDTTGAGGLATGAGLALFALAVSVLAGLGLGLGPALSSTRVDVAGDLKEGIGGRSAGRARGRGVLVIAQLALSLALLSGGGLFLTTLRAYRSLVTVPQPERVLLASVQPSHQGYAMARTQEYFRQLLERVERLPGVTAATVARDVNLNDGSFFDANVSAGGGPEGEPPLQAGYAVVAPGWFRTLGAGALRGRDFGPEDREGAPPVAIVNATLASRLWPGQDPIGRALRVDGGMGMRTVVGVAMDRPTRDGPRPFLYYPLSQLYPWPGSVHVLEVRASGDPLALLPALRREAAALDPSLPLFRPRTLEREMAAQRFFERVAVAILGGSGLLGLLLAVVGLYGLVSHWVAQRTQEIGVRMALGARPGEVTAAVVGRALRLALGGVLIGLLASLVVERLCAAWLFRARAAEPAVLAAAGALLLAAAAVASYLPARRAATVDPNIALRCE